MRRKLHNILVAFVEINRRLLPKPDAGRRAAKDYRPCWQCGTLREEAHKFCTIEDHITG